MTIVVIIWLSCGGLICGALSAAIASIKGRSGFGWFVLGLLLGPLAVIAVGLMPKMGPPIECPNCGRPAISKATGCNRCGTQFAKPCPSCGRVDRPVDAKVCPWCSTPLGVGSPGACRACGHEGVPAGAKVCPWCAEENPVVASVTEVLDVPEVPVSRARDGAQRISEGAERERAQKPRLNWKPKGQ